MQTDKTIDFNLKEITSLNRVKIKSREQIRAGKFIELVKKNKLNRINVYEEVKRVYQAEPKPASGKVSWGLVRGVEVGKVGGRGGGGGNMNER